MGCGMRPSTARRGIRRWAHRVAHLVKRFTWAMTAPRPSDADRAWVESVLLPGEAILFQRMSRADQEHHLRVARRFVASAGPGDVPREWVAAALLHDVGKLVCGLGTWGRVLATLWPLGRDGDGRIGRYERHEGIGASLAKEMGSTPLTVALIGKWPGAPGGVAAALHAADDL